MEEKLIHSAKANQAAKAAAIGEMTSVLAHELNQPIAAITNYARGCIWALRSGNVSKDEIIEAIEDIILQSERAGNIIHRLRAFLAKGIVKRSNVNLNTLIKKGVDLLRLAIDESNIIIKYNLDENVPLVFIDPVQIEQVIINLVQNAIDAMYGIQDDKRIIIISTKLHEKSEIIFTVKDSGPGIGEIALKKVFTAFYTTKTDGIGLGLSITKTIVDAHQGKIHLLSSDTGCVFEVRFPLFKGVDHA